MSLTIPIWLLWTIGIIVLGPIILFMLMCTYMGFLFIVQDTFLGKWFK
jgi:hypothetical protein